ncbi:MAG: hypothetical protein ACRCUP_06760, partial [Mycoplasmatales bacterium]
MLDLITTYAYDKLGNKTQVVYPNGQTETTVYDAEERVLEQKDAIGNISQKTYDDLGRVIAESDVRGNKTTKKYDQFDRLIEQK